MNDFIKNKNKNNVPKKAKVSKRTRIVFICLFVLWTLGAILSIFTFVSDNVKTASADTIETDYTFNGSNLYLPVKYTKFNDVEFTGNLGYTSLLDFKVSISYNSSNNTYSLFFSDTHIIGLTPSGFAFGDCRVLSSTYGNIGASGVHGASVDSVFDLPYSTNQFNYILLGNGDSLSQSTYICELIVRFDGSLTFDYVNIGSRSDATSLYNFVEYGSNCQFHSRVSQSFGLDTRTYLFTTELTDNTSYQLGYNSGYANGNTIGYENGLNTGYNNGYTVGYNNGKTDGIASANDYTFLGLISSVIDVPIRAISSLFSFEIFGYDMTNFVFTLFTLCACITIIKLFF